MFDWVRMPLSYGWSLKRFFQHPISPKECDQQITRQIQQRAVSFLRIVERGIFAHDRSPYRRLLHHAGIEFEDVSRLVRQEGLEAALTRLYRAGVYVTLDEFKGRQPIQRSGLQFLAQPQDFDNPLLAAAYEAETGGSRGAGTRVLIDLDLLSHEAAYHALFLAAFSLDRCPIGVWLPVLPGVIATKLMLCYAKLGKPVERWFTQSKLAIGPGSYKSFLFTQGAVYGSRWWGTPLAAPEHVPLADAGRVVEWLVKKKAQGTPALLVTNPSSAVRVCQAAQELGFDIAGTFFHVAGEPYTPAKAQVITASGGRAKGFYGMAEIGIVGMACATPTTLLDEVHVFSDKLAIIQQERPIGIDGRRVGALFYSTLLPSCPKLMLNVDNGDYAVLDQRTCGCAFERVGFHQHLHTIRSYEKLTSEGMTFLGSQFLALVEEILPARFGGSPTDYQFVEEEEGGLPKVSLFVSPRVGPIDEAQLTTAVLHELRIDSKAERMMADRWREGQTLRIVRREPYATHAAKVLPLHVLRNAQLLRGRDLAD